MSRGGSQDPFYRRLDQAEQDGRIKRILADRPENLHDYQGCANDSSMTKTPTRDDIGASKERQEEAEFRYVVRIDNEGGQRSNYYCDAQRDVDALLADMGEGEVLISITDRKPAQPKESVQPQLPPRSGEPYKIYTREEWDEFNEAFASYPNLPTPTLGRWLLERERQLLTAMAELATLRAERAKMVEVIKLYRGDGQHDTESRLCGCYVCNLADSLLPPEPTPEKENDDGKQ